MGRWVVLDPIAMTSTTGTTLSRLPDKSILASGTSPATDTYTIVAETDLEHLTAVRIEVLDDPSLPAKGPGRAASGNFILSEIALTATRNDAPGRCVTVGLQAPSADFSQAQWDVGGAIDGNPKTGWAIAQQFGAPHRAVIETNDDNPGGRRHPAAAWQAGSEHHGDQHTIGRLRLAVTNRKRPVEFDGLPDDVAEILVLAPEGWTDAQRERLSAYHRTIDAEWTKRKAAVAAHAKKAPAPSYAREMTLAENPNPPTTHILIRGDFLRPGAEVGPHTPAILPHLDAASAAPTRLDLARWLVDPANPLTTRVAVNRTWRHLFGRPLVATVEDFGTRGEPPTHPELLDWLAAEFPARSWSPKALIRLIVTSATYRQASRTRPELVDRDPNNNWLARQNRFRAEAEVLRDLALTVSGLLEPKIGGPSVRPPQPPGISDLTYAGSAHWVESTGPDRYRRGLYTWFQRTSPYPMLVAFDAPDANVCAAKRERSDTPLQALTLLNDEVFIECAQAFGHRIVAELRCQGAAELRIAYAFRLCLARRLPTAAEARPSSFACGRDAGAANANPVSRRQRSRPARRSRLSTRGPEASCSGWLRGRPSNPRRVRHAGIVARPSERASWCSVTDAIRQSRRENVVTLGRQRRDPACPDVVAPRRGPARRRARLQSAPPTPLQSARTSAAPFSRPWPLPARSASISKSARSQINQLRLQADRSSGLEIERPASARVVHQERAVRLHPQGDRPYQWSARRTFQITIRT